MLIPHLHFSGNCKEAISFYEKAFNIKADSIIFNSDYAPEEYKSDTGVAHAEMRIHGQKVYLNDRFGKKDTSTDIAIHLIVTFKNEDDLLSCYDKMKDGSIIIDPLEALPYTPLAVQFIDKYGVQWGFMVDESMGG
ncbi:MAG: VOC family protein [Clostridiales bacterium]|jgi:PhnB protein|nr:VOC family protein [Clostridiales bacterium]